MIFVSKFNFVSAEVEDSSQSQESLRRDILWRGHASSLPLELNLQKLLVMLFTYAPTPKIVLLEK